MVLGALQGGEQETALEDVQHIKLEEAFVDCSRQSLIRCQSSANERNPLQLLAAQVIQAQARTVIVH